jgi:Cu/Ag efflux protein CusF
MKRLVVVIAVAAFLALMARHSMAQSKTIAGETTVVTATVEAIEASTRTLTLKKPDGTYVTAIAPPEMKRFPELKIGDRISARYYENMVIRLKRPGEKVVDASAQSTTPAGQIRPGGTAAKQRTMTATITAIDANTPSITFTGPNDWKYSSRVQDRSALAGVKVGDKVDITWTEALLVSVDSPSK